MCENLPTESSKISLVEKIYLILMIFLLNLVKGFVLFFFLIYVCNCKSMSTCILPFAKAFAFFIAILCYYYLQKTGLTLQSDLVEMLDKHNKQLYCQI